MDEILIYIRSLLVNDSILQSLWQGAGKSSVSCISHAQRTQADYPRIVYAGYQGKGFMSGDAIPKFFNGTLEIEVVARKSVNNQQPLEFVRLCEARILLLILGNKRHGMSPLQGTRTGNYSISTCNQNYSMLLPKYDPTIERWGCQFEVTINNLTANLL